jgi:hypothetical protein
MSERQVILTYEFDNQQYEVLAEDDSTPAAAWPAYLDELLADWIRYRPRQLRPKRLLRGELVLEEHHDGVISHVSDSSVTVRYGFGEDEFEVEYPRTQFEDGAELNRGDEIEAVIGLLRVPRSPVSLNSLYTDDEQRALDAAWQQKKGVVGDLKL